MNIIHTLLNDSPELLSLHTTAIRDPRAFFGFHKDLLGNRSKCCARIFSDFAKSLKGVNFTREMVRKNPDIVPNYLSSLGSYLKSDNIEVKTEAHSLVTRWAYAVASNDLHAEVSDIQKLSSMLFSYSFSPEEIELIKQKMLERDIAHGFIPQEQRLVDAFTNNPLLLNMGEWESVVEYGMGFFGLSEKQSQLEVGSIIVNAAKADHPLYKTRHQWALAFLSENALHFKSFKAFKDFHKKLWTTLPPHENELLSHFNKSKKALLNPQPPVVTTTLDLTPFFEGVEDYDEPVEETTPVETQEVTPQPVEEITPQPVETEVKVKLGDLVIRLTQGATISFKEVAQELLSVDGKARVSISEVKEGVLKEVRISC